MTSKTETCRQIFTHTNNKTDAICGTETASIIDHLRSPQFFWGVCIDLCLIFYIGFYLKVVCQIVGNLFCHGAVSYLRRAGFEFPPRFSSFYNSWTFKSVHRVISFSYQLYTNMNSPEICVYLPLT